MLFLLGSTIVFGCSLNPNRYPSCHMSELSSLQRWLPSILWAKILNAGNSRGQFHEIPSSIPRSCTPNVVVQWICPLAFPASCYNQLCSFHHLIPSFLCIFCFTQAFYPQFSLNVDLIVCNMLHPSHTWKWFRYTKMRPYSPGVSIILVILCLL